MRNLSRKRRLVGAVITMLVLGVVGPRLRGLDHDRRRLGLRQGEAAQALTTIDVSASTSATLYPGADGNVLIKISNPNPYPVQVTDVTGNGAITADSGHSTCGSDVGHPTGVTFTDQTGQTINVAASASTQTTLTGAAHMSNASDDSCQGATFTIPVTLSGHSNA